jgi:hypothetical protein
MATQRISHSSVCVSYSSPSGFPYVKAGARLRSELLLFSALVLFLAASPARAQFQQPLVFSSGGAVVVRDDATGVLTPTNGSPFLATNTTLTIDVQGRYLFGTGVNSIHMYAITDSSTGAYQEVQNSPFASANTNSPIFIAVEPSGNYLAVVNSQSGLAGQAGAETFQISPNASGGPALIPVANSFTQLDSMVVGVSQPASSAQAFYLYLGPHFPSNPNFPDGEEFDAVSIDAQTGQLQGISSQNIDNSTARCYGSDPQGRYIVTGRGEFEGLLELIGIDGTFPGVSITLGEGTFPDSVWVDSTGTFLYASVSPGGDGPVHIYSLNLQTFTLAETASSPLPNATAVPSYQPDPTGPFNYAPQFNGSSSAILAYTVDPQTGYFNPTTVSPVAIAGLGQLSFSIVLGSQGVSGPSVEISPAALSLGTLQIGSPSAPQMIMVKSDGAEALDVNSIAITGGGAVSGASAGQFIETDTCQAPAVLQPNKFCSISITFTPSAAGPQAATLTITDNAPGSPQSVQLSGAGVAPPPPAPMVSVTPNPTTFATTTQGTSSTAMSIAVTNSGNATLHISSLIIGGNNSADFISPASNCSGAALAANASCTISVTFAPLAAGQRSETVTLTDDAANSPQVILVQGNATAAISLAPASNSSATVTVAPGATAQYQLQITPGANYSGTISIACSGAPLAATCVIPSAVQVSSGAPAMFSVMITTTGNASLAPRIFPGVWLAPRLGLLRTISFAAIFLLWLALLSKILPEGSVFGQPGHARPPFQRNFALSRELVALGTLAIFGACAGCGGGGASSSPQVQIVTPQGTSTITITPSAKNAAGQPLQLPPIQLTLTVN